MALIHEDGYKRQRFLREKKTSGIPNFKYGLNSKGPPTLWAETEKGKWIFYSIITFFFGDTKVFIRK